MPVDSVTVINRYVRMAAQAPVGDLKIAGQTKVLLTAWWDCKNTGGKAVVGGVRLTLNRMGRAFGFGTIGADQIQRVGPTGTDTALGPTSGEGNPLVSFDARPITVQPGVQTAGAGYSSIPGYIAGGVPSPTVQMLLDGNMLNDIQSLGAPGFASFVRWDVDVELMQDGQPVDKKTIENAFKIVYTTASGIALVGANSPMLDVALLSAGTGGGGGGGSYGDTNAMRALSAPRDKDENEE